MLEYQEKNPLRVIVLVLIIIFLVFIIIPWDSAFPQKPITNNTVYVNVTNTIYVTITPTPDNGYYYVGEYDNGIRKLNKPFSWYREDVTGKKDMKVTVRVYDYRLLPAYKWFNVHDYKYYAEYPTTNDNQFLFIFINIYMDDIEGDDTRIWLPPRNSYAVQINGILYPPVNYPLDLRIKELEETSDYNDVIKVKAYGQYVYTALSGGNAGKQESINVTYLRGGKSNAEDGYIIYEIPKHISIDNILIQGQFFSFGNAQWRLK
jgi:hypothetical protein